MSILFLGCLYSDLQKDLFMRKSKNGIQFAAQVFQESLIDGFIKNGVTLEVLTVPPLGTFPISYRSPIVKTVPFVLQEKVLGTSLGFLNIPFFNHPSSYRMQSIIEEWFQENNSLTKKSIVVYGLHVTLLSEAVKFKRKHKDVNICSIVPDLPEYMACNKYYKMLGLKNRDIKLINKLVKDVDSFVLLSKYMREKLDISDKPSVVIEGIYSNTLADNTSNSDKKIVTYTGALSKRYGIMDLVEAFHNITKDDYSLFLCGTGDAVSDICEYALRDKRICYFGKKSHQDVLKLQQESTLLVNPRHSDEVFTRYSFPSKTMEYMASGTPVVMCPLACLPDDYKEHLFFFDDESVEGFKNRLIDICEMKKSVLSEHGRKARIFILDKKNSVTQVRKILNMMDYNAQ